MWYIVDYVDSNSDIGPRPVLVAVFDDYTDAKAFVKSNAEGLPYAEVAPASDFPEW